MSKKKRIVKAEPKEEPTPELEVVEAVIEETTPLPAEAEGMEEVPVTAEEPKTLPHPKMSDFEMDVLNIYEGAEEGTELIPYLIEKTGKPEIEIRQAWDRLYDYHLVQRSVVPYRK